MGGVVKSISKGLTSASNPLGAIGGDPSRLLSQAGGAVGWDPYKTQPGAFAPDSGEKGLIKALQDRAYGRAPSAAEMQMHRGLDQGVAQSNAMAASARGIEPALAQRMALTNQANMAQDVNSQSGVLRAQEMANAQNSLANELQSVRTGRMQEQGLRAGAYEGAMNRRQNIIQGIGQGAMMMAMADGGEVLDPGEIHTMEAPDFLSAFHPSSLKEMNFKKPGAKGGAGGGSGQVGQGGMAGGADAADLSSMATMMAARGGRVPGDAESRGDSYSNDTIPAMLSPGEIVIPRSVAQNPNAPDMAREFVAQIKRQKELKGQGPDGPSYAKVLALHRDMGEVIKKLAMKQSKAKGA